MNDDKLIDKIIDSQDIKTVQLNFRNDTLTEQEFTLFNTNTLTQTEGNITYNTPNDTTEYVDELPIDTLGAIYVPLVNKIYTGTQSYTGYGLYIKDLNTNLIIQKYSYDRFLGFINNTNNDILYAYSINQEINYPSYTYKINLINTTTDEIIASYDCPNLDIFSIDSFTFCEASNCIYYLTVLNKLFRFDCTTNAGSILDLPVNIQQSNWMQYSSVNGKLYVDYTSFVSPYFGVLVIDPETNQIEELIDVTPVYAFGFPFTTFCSFNNSIYLLSDYGSVYVFDCNTNTLSFLLDVNPSYPYFNSKNIIYNPNNNQVYIIYSDSWYSPLYTGNFIDVLDCNTNTIINTLNSFQPYNFESYICFFQNNQLVICWDNPYAPNDLWEGVDCNTDTNYIYLQYTGLNFYNIKVSQQEQLLYLVCGGTPKKVLVYDLNYNLITTINLSFTQFHLLYNSLLNQMFVYGVDGAEVIDCATNTITQSIPFVVDATGGVFNVVNNKYYLGYDDYYLLEIDAITYTQNVIVTPYLSANGGDFGITFDASNNTIYQIGYSDNNVWSYDVTNGISTLLLDGNALNINIRRIKFNPLNNSIYLLVEDYNISTKVVLVINTDGIILNQLELPSFTNFNNNSSNISFNPYNNTIVFITTKNASNIFNCVTINCTTNQVTYEPSLYFFSLDFNLLNNKFYVALNSFSGTFNLPSLMSSLVPLSNVYVSGGSIDYNFFVQTLINDPKLIYDILIKMPQRYLANPVNIIYTDANGESTITPYLPNTDIDAFQKSPNRGIIRFDNGLVIDINTQIQIIIPPLTTVILLLDYKEFLKSDMLDLVVYDDNGKAKYIIDENLGDRKIIAKKYWGSKSMPKQMVLDKEWLSDMRSRFSKVEVLEYDTPKLAGGTTEIRGMFKDLFGFKKQVKSKFIGITQPPKYKKGVDVKLSSKKESIKPRYDYVQVEQVYQDLININAHEIPLEKISIPKVDKVKPAIVEVENITPIDVFNQSFEDYGNVYLVGVKQPCKQKENKEEYVYGVYYIRENSDRFTALKHSGDDSIPIKIELNSNWYNDLKNRFDDIQILTIVQKKI